MPTTRKPAPIVAIARKSSRTRRLHRPITMPTAPAATMLAGAVIQIPKPALASKAVV